jgi:hypothetical protein
MQQRDYIIDKIDKAAQFIASLVSNRKTGTKDQAVLDQALSDLTGLNSAFFKDSDPRLLKALLPMLADNNTKALVARILQQKDPVIYGELYDSLMSGINLDELAPKIKALFGER